MKRSYSISSYCSIRNNSIIVDDTTLFIGPDSGAEEFFLAAYRHFAINYPKFHKMDNLSKLGFLSAELLLKDRNLGLQYSGDEVGIILMNASSSLDTDKSYQETINYRDNYFPSPSVFVYTLPNIVIGEICIKHKFFGEGSFFVLKEFDTFFLVDYVLSILDNDVLKCCIAGWVEINQDDFKSVVYLIEDTIKSDVKFAKFEPTAVQNIFEKTH